MKFHLPQHAATGLLLLLTSIVPVTADDETADAAQTDEKRHVALEGQSNFRDIGGYKTQDGRRVKLCQLYRSGELPKLTDRDLDTLSKLQLKTVVNFLTQTEIEAHGKDRLPDRVREMPLPISGGIAGDLAAKILRARQTADFSQVPVDINPKIHRLLVRDARDEYAALFKAAADPANRPLVFHCSHGVHRTGTAAALLLSALGVPWKTVRQDYLLSNHYRQHEIRKRLEQFRLQAAKNQGIQPDQVDMTNFNAFYILDCSYIDATLDEAVKQYGSLESYILKGLGVSDETINQLRHELLE